MYHTCQLKCREYIVFFLHDRPRKSLKQQKTKLPLHWLVRELINRAAVRRGSEKCHGCNYVSCPAGGILGCIEEGNISDDEGEGGKEKERKKKKLKKKKKKVITVCVCVQ